MGLGNQLPTVPDEWYPLTGSAQYLTAATSTALTLPSVASGQPAKGAVYVGILTAMLGTMWIRFDGTTASALIGARTVEQLDNSLDALNNAKLSEAELAEIEKALK